MGTRMGGAEKEKDKEKKDEKKSKRQELSSKWSGGKCLLYLPKGGRRLHDTVQ